MATLVFIDTNIYLDFYRVRGGDASLSILQHFDSNHDRIITTSEVEMEYKKNRQRVILDSLKNIGYQDLKALVVPAFLQESNLNRNIKRTQGELSKQIKMLRDRTAKLLKSPSRNDPVYRVLQRLFKARSPCHLSRDKKVRFEIRDLANKRFILGYPPKKERDLSIIDEINWEWIIYCAKHCTDDIVIVSRDFDYGISYQGESVLNDWLLQEFKERVSHKRSVSLTARLTEAFKLASIKVSREEEEFEELLIQPSKYLKEIFKRADLDTLKSEMDMLLTENRKKKIEDIDLDTLRSYLKENESPESS